MLIDATHLKLIKAWCEGFDGNSDVHYLVWAGYASYTADKPSWA